MSLRLVCRHLREQEPEAWGFYLNGPLPDPLGLAPSAISTGGVRRGRPGGDG